MVTRSEDLLQQMLVLYSKYRARVTPAKRGKGRKIKPLDATQDHTPAERRKEITMQSKIDFSAGNRHHGPREYKSFAEQPKAT